MPKEPKPLSILIMENICEISWQMRNDVEWLNKEIALAKDDKQKLAYLAGKLDTYLTVSDMIIELMEGASEYSKNLTKANMPIK